MKANTTSALLQGANSHHDRLTISLSIRRNSISDFDMIDRDFVRGFIKLYALSLAAEGEVYGLKILEEMNKHRFSLSPGTLDPALPALLHEGDVTVRRRMVGGKIRKCYRLTAKGDENWRKLRSVRTLVSVVFR